MLFLFQMNSLRIFIVLIFGLVFSTGSLLAQNPVMKVISDTSCQSFIETPILVSDFDSVAAISMKIVFDTTRLTYLGYRSAHPAVTQNGNFIAATYQDRFIIGWFSLNPITIASDTLIVIRWQGSPGPPVRLWFDTTRGMCELVDFYGVRFNTQFLDGAVAPSIRVAPGLVAPSDTSGFVDSDVLFVFDESICRTGPTLVQVSRDSLFSPHPDTTSTLTTSTFYRWYSIPFCSNPHQGGPTPENGLCWQPSTGDSVLCWRVGSVFGTDTLWSSSRRIGLALTAALPNCPANTEWRMYPNPVSDVFYIRSSESLNSEDFSLVLYSANGTVLDKDSYEISFPTSTAEKSTEIKILLNKIIPNGYYTCVLTNNKKKNIIIPFLRL